MYGPTSIFWANLTPFSLCNLFRGLGDQLDERLDDGRVCERGRVAERVLFMARDLAMGGDIFIFISPWLLRVENHE
jgi:hypothetical protein